MSLLATLPAAGLSLAGLAWIRAADPKRRRAFGLAPHAGERRRRLAWGAVLLPGAAVPFWSGAAGFMIWLGATCALGWVLAATPPGRGAPPAGRVGAWMKARDRGRDGTPERRDNSPA